MKVVDFKILTVDASTVVFASTSEPDYEMERIILLEDDGGYDFIVVEGGHCSCFGFDETEWFATGYSREELRTLANADYYKSNTFWQMVKKYIS